MISARAEKGDNAQQTILPLGMCGSILLNANKKDNHECAYIDLRQNNAFSMSCT